VIWLGFPPPAEPAVKVIFDEVEVFRNFFVASEFAQVDERIAQYRKMESRCRAIPTANFAALCHSSLQRR
jgi:hypothetical protein